MNLDQAIANTRAHLLSLRNAAGHWEGELSSSALSTATAIVALSLVDEVAHGGLVARGAAWLRENQNADGGWGDTTISKSNLSTTLLCWSALSLYERAVQAARDRAEPITGRVPVERIAVLHRCEERIRKYVGSLEPDAICKAVIARYGKDKTFSVPILMTCAIGGRLGPHDEAWRRVLALPFELAAFPRAWFGAIGLPVVSYALPALIAIGHARFFHAPPRWWNPLRWLRRMLWPRISPLLKTLQPSTGGYLEATPLTSFVTMALACAGQEDHPCVPDAVRFLTQSQREDGSWAIDTNLATWATTLAVKALYGSADTPVRTQTGLGGVAQPRSEPAKLSEADRSVRAPIKAWLLDQQYKTIHPFTNAAPGGWAWTDLPGGVPDADDTSGALIALWHLCETDDERREIIPAIEAGIKWLLDLQNRDGGVPTFCRGWGTLPFDRSTPEITAHVLWAFGCWCDWVSEELQQRISKAQNKAARYLMRDANKTHWSYLRRVRGDKKFRIVGPIACWEPLWFGNESTGNESNLVFGTACVLRALCHLHEPRFDRLKAGAFFWLADNQHESGGWGAEKGVDPTIEETALALSAIATCQNIEAGLRPHDRNWLPKPRVQMVADAAKWLLSATQNGTHFPATPIGLYFAKLWYHEKIYPVVWTLGALQQAAAALADKSSDSP
jgi:squalene-hopene/tetraprenyl-beta-curcumene cyclase